MRTLSKALLISSMLLMSSVSQAAQTTGNFKAQTTLGNYCQVSASDMHFTMENFSNVNTATSAVSLLCTQNTAYSLNLVYTTLPNSYIGQAHGSKPGNNDIWGYDITSDSGNNHLLGAGQTPFKGVGTGSTQSIPLYGWGNPANTVSADNYSEVVTVTISY